MDYDFNNKTTLGKVKIVMLKGEQGPTGHGPLVAKYVADMVDKTQTYVYTGDETGYIFGYWYYWDGEEWAAGGQNAATVVETDKTFSVEDMAADAKAVGTALYQGRSRAQTSVYPFVTFAPASTPFDIQDMPRMSTFTGTPVNFNLGSNFTWALKQNTSYRLIRFSDLVIVSSPGTQETYIGSISLAGVALWQKMEVDATLSIEGDAADAEAVGTALYRGRSRAQTSVYPFVTFTPASTPFNIQDMPRMSTYTGTPAMYNLGANFIWSLKSDASYRLVRFSDLVIISSPGTQETYIGSISLAGVALWQKLASDDAYKEIDDAVQVYSNFKLITGKTYSQDQLINSPSGVTVGATEKILCSPSTVYYNRFPNIVYNGTTVVFFDANGAYISHIKQEQFDSYSYTSPDGKQVQTGYLPIKTFTTPSNCRYFAFNWSTSGTYDYAFYVANIPVFMIGFKQPDLIIPKTSPVCSKKEKTLCVMGPSGVMIDRLYREGNANDYISGFQEHLRPFYKDIISYGYSSASYAVGATADPSIYEYITQGVGSLAAKDFTAIDEVLFIQSGTGLDTLSVGDPGDLDEDVVDTGTMVGALRGIVQYILSQNPKCKIYMASYYKYNNSLANPTKVYAVHDALKELCNNLGLTYIDLWRNTPFNYSNYTADNKIYTYDGGHANSDGNRALAAALKRYMLP